MRFVAASISRRQNSINSLSGSAFANSRRSFRSWSSRVLSSPAIFLRRSLLRPIPRLSLYSD